MGESYIPGGGIKMLTPVDLQQKKFKQGMGYARKDVDSFFDIVVHSYTDLYKSNAELTNQVKTLTDTLVHYRTTESKLQKSLMLAEKNAEESAKNASDKARLIENDAKLKANSIVHEAKEELDRIEGSIESIKQQYRDYAASFKNMMDAHLRFLAENPINEELGVDFSDVMKYSNEYAGASYGTPDSSKGMSSEDKFAAFSGDPQGREESSLGSGSGSAMGDSTLGGMSSGSVTSDSSVYTKNLGGGSFVDPFKFTNND
jgi:DivIVA domain-containing protein